MMLLLILALIPFCLTVINLWVLRAPGRSVLAAVRISVLIPARNEQSNIAACVSAVLANDHPDFEIIVLDDGSTDDTASIVSSMAVTDRRLRLETASPLPAGWCGKVHACHQLSVYASGEIWMFLDADVTLSPHALRRISNYMAGHPHVALASGVPRQITVALAEKLIVPLINFLLLGYLPIPAMRRFRMAGFAAACGQLIVARRDGYLQAGGHAAIQATLHDGLNLARSFRRHGLKTDLFDASTLASCRMYHGWREVWQGFSKNAVEGLATPKALPVWTVLLAGGNLLPFLIVAVAQPAGFPAIAACLLVLAARIAIAVRFGESRLGAILHPFGICLMLAIQWSALLASLLGKPVGWRGRIYRCKA